MKTGNKITLLYTLLITIIMVGAALIYHTQMSSNHKSIFLGIAILAFFAILVFIAGKLLYARMINRMDDAIGNEKAFISNASHELNNPLTAIQGECEISLKKDRDIEEYKLSLRTIESETERIIGLMRNLLFLSRGDKEILKNEMETVCLTDFLLQFVNERVHLNQDNFAFTFRANSHLIKTAIGNIIDNALKYSGNKPVELWVEDNTLTIKDQGIGIPSEDLKMIFHPFFRASNVRGFSGRGIGLSLSHRILEAYKAKMKITSEIGKGTTVIIDFPMRS